VALPPLLLLLMQHGYASALTTLLSAPPQSEGFYPKVLSV
jgi:hypothetical protein